MMHCDDCGLPYEEFGIDLVLPDQQWKPLAGEAKLLCASCICRRADKCGGRSVVAWVLNFDYDKAENNNDR